MSGWASGPIGTPVPLFGEKSLAPLPGMSEGAIFDETDLWLNHMLTTLRPDFVIAEDVFIPRNQAVARRLYGIRALCSLACHRHRVRLRRVPVQTVHKFFTGGGEARGRKKAATMAMCRRYGFRPETDNQGDALALFLWGEAQISPTVAAHRSAGPLWARAG